MAEQASIFRQNTFYGGYSDDEFLGAAGSFYRAKGIEIRKNPRTINLQKDLVELSAGNITGEIISSIVLSTGEKLIGDSAGKIYYQASGSSTWTTVYTHTDAIWGMGEYNDYFYWADDGDLNRTALSDVSSFAAPTIAYKALSGVNTYYKPMVEAYNKLFIGTANVVDSLDSVGTLTTADLTVAGEDVVRNINFSGTTMRIYCRKSANTVDGGAVYFWTGIGAYQEKTRLDGMFQCSTTMENVDYFIAGLEPWLYRLDGLTATKVKRIPQRDSSFTDTVPVHIEINPMSMTNLNGIIYFGTGTSVAIAGIGAHYVEKGVWSYGRLQEGYPYSMTLEWASSDYGDKMTDVSALFAAQGQLNVIGKLTSTYHAFVLDFDAYQADGEIEFRVFDANKAWQIKQALRLHLAFYTLAAGEKIEVFIKQNLESSYGSAVLTADYTDTEDQNVNYKDLVDPFTEQEFNYIQFKIKLTAGTTQLTTPKLTDFAMIFEQIKET